MVTSPRAFQNEKKNELMNKLQINELCINNFIFSIE